MRRCIKRGVENDADYDFAATVGEHRNVGAYLTFALYHWPFT
jgi:hypothetical protein